MMKILILTISTFLSFVFLPFQGGAIAQPLNPLEIQNMDIRSARNIYPGGVDEEDIKVIKDDRNPIMVVNLKLIQNKVKEDLLNAVAEESETETSPSAESNSQKKNTP